MHFTLSGAAVAVLDVPEPERKARRSRAAAADWRGMRINEVGEAAPPERPARPPRPPLLPPRAVPRRKIGSNPAGRIALLHALAHIELNAIDLAWDIIARFTDESLPRNFYDDWVEVADEEAKHFELLSERLAELGAAYGDLPAHDGLWEAAMATSQDVMARLAVVPMVLEARGLDVTPATVARLRAVGDARSAEILQLIYEEEIGHVAKGRHWFEWLCEARELDPPSTWRELVHRHFPGRPKPPFNELARSAAGFPRAYYAAFEQPASTQEDDRG
jgi:uncharacterized ferritin-like protein (DUF455 family)